MPGQMLTLPRSLNGRRRPTSEQVAQIRIANAVAVADYQFGQLSCD